MNEQVRKFEARPAIRESVPLLIGLFGPSGSGKSFSALRLATGIQAITGGDIYAIDTESRRMLHYADDFKFKHVQFDAPFGSLDYLAAMQQCVKEGAKTIIVDSMSHEHSGPGGYLLTQEAELDRIAGDDWKKRDRAKFTGWIKPAKLRGQMLTGILQLNANFIFTFRAKEKTRPVKNNEGKIEPVEMGFMPIAGEELLFEMTVNCLLLPKANGLPTWRSDQIGERLMLKLPRQFENLFREPRPLDEDIGRQLADWARGAKITNTATDQEAPAAPSDDFGDTSFSEELTKHDNALTAAAEQGMDALKKAWDDMPKKFRETLKSALDRRHKVRAVTVDAEKKAAAA